MSGIVKRSLRRGGFRLTVISSGGLEGNPLEGSGNFTAAEFGHGLSIDRKDLGYVYGLGLQGGQAHFESVRTRGYLTPVCFCAKILLQQVWRSSS